MPARESEEGPRDAARQILSLDHGHPRLDGVSGYSPPDHESFRRLVQEFPADTALAAAYARGARYVVVRYGDLGRTAAERLQARLAEARDLELVQRFGTDAIYRWRR
jgi:hypothetical protein